MKKFIIVIVCLILMLLTGCVQDSKHLHNSCLECGKCISKDCDGLEEEKCQGHQAGHQHVECKVCGKCVDVECTGLEEDKCQSCQDNEYHEICDICNKCYVPDCGWIEKYKGCPSHIKTVKNHFITFDDNIMDSFETHSYYEIKTCDEFIELITLYDLSELIIMKDEIYSDRILNVEYSKEFFQMYNEEYFETKSLIIFSYKDKYDFRDICYVVDCYYFNGILNVLHTGGMSQYEPKYNCSICSFVEIEKDVIPYIKEFEFQLIVIN